jgi:ABC-2 type transport system permease protein
MLNVFRAEWRKLRRPMLVAGSMAGSLFFTVLVSIFLFKNVDSPDGNGDRGAMIGRPILESTEGSVIAIGSVGFFLGITVLCVFSAQISHEYTYGTLRNLLVRQPSRFTLLMGKFAAMKSFALLIAFVNMFISLVIVYLIAPSVDVSTALWFTSEGWSEIARTFLNIFISLIFFGIFGLVLGLIFRSPISSISIGVIWSLILEGLLSLVNSNAPKWTPVSQFTTIASGGSEDISYQYALTLGSAYVALFTVISIFLFVKRDVAN